MTRKNRPDKDLTYTFTYRYAIGIDAGQHTGVATWDTESKELSVSTCDFWTAFDYVCTAFNPVDTLIVIEDPSQNRPTFGREASMAVGVGVLDRRAQGVGSVKRESLLLAEGLERRGFSVALVRPKGSRTDKGKWTNATFERLTGIKGRQSQHARDAARLVFGLGGRSVLPVK